MKTIKKFELEQRAAYAVSSVNRSKSVLGLRHGYIIAQWLIDKGYLTYDGRITKRGNNFSSKYYTAISKELNVRIQRRMGEKSHLEDYATSY